MKQVLPLAQWLTAARPNHTLIAWQGEQSWTLGQLRQDVVILMQNLQQHQGERWALCFENSYLFIVALLATLYAGKTPVIPGHRRVSLLEQQQELFNGILSDSALAWSGQTVLVQSADHQGEYHEPLPALEYSAQIELFTSGTTGQPRLVAKPIACLDHEAVLLAERFSAQLTGCRIVASVMPQHLYGLTFRIFLPMALGLPLHTAMIQYTEQLVALSPEYPYAFISSPAFLKRVDRQLIAPKLRQLFSAGNALPWAHVLETAEWLGIWPDEIYGSTETGILAWCHRQQQDTAWQLFPGVCITAENNRFRAVSPLIADPEGFLLDDILHFDQQGCFHLQGRGDRVVKIEEKRISLSEIEQRLLQIGGVVDAAALPITQRGRQGVGALLVLDKAAHQQWQHSRGQTQELSWRRALLPFLEPVAVPRYWRVVDEIPVNNMNKRIYTQLQELFYDAG